MEKTCIVPACSRPANSREHVVLSGLGGRLKLRGVFCKCSHEEVGCNTRLGDILDAPLTDAYRPFSTFLNVAGDRPRRRTTGPSLRGLKGDDDKLYDVQGGGQPGMQKAKVNVNEGPNGSKQITIHARSPEEARRLLESQFKRFGVDPGNPLSAIEAARATRVRSYPGLEIESVPVGGPEQFRAVTKMALAFLAGRAELVHLHPEAFRAALSFMNDGVGQPGVLANHDYVSAFPAPQTNRNHGTFDHSVTVCGEKGHALVGFVTLFGHFRFSVILSPSSPETVALHYVVCPQSGDHEEVHGFPFDQATCNGANAHAFDQAAILAALEKAWGEVQKQGRDEGLEAILERGLGLLREHDGEVFTPELADQLTRQMSEELTSYLLRLSEEHDVSDDYFNNTPEEQPPST